MRKKNSEQKLLNTEISERKRHSFSSNVQSGNQSVRRRALQQNVERTNVALFYA